mgnify:CR=1 FL=1
MVSTVNILSNRPRIKRTHYVCNHAHLLSSILNHDIWQQKIIIDGHKFRKKYGTEQKQYHSSTPLVSSHKVHTWWQIWQRDIKLLKILTEREEMECIRLMLMTRNYLSIIHSEYQCPLCVYHIKSPTTKTLAYCITTTTVKQWSLLPSFKPTTSDDKMITK